MSRVQRGREREDRLGWASGMLLERVTPPETAPEPVDIRRHHVDDLALAVGGFGALAQHRHLPETR